MIEFDVRAYLDSADVPALMEIPAQNIPAAFIVVERTGGGETNHIRNATVAVQSYASTLLRAAQLNDNVISEMLDMITQPRVCRVDLNSSYNFTDTASKRYRYQSVFDIVYYEKEDEDT